eukprot:jgi/Chrzof1/3305/Cz12g20090.t1
MERKQHVAGTSRPDFVYDWARTCRLCLYSALIGTPVGHWWFGFLDKNIFPTRMGHPITALAKTALDQLFMAPLGIAMFFFSVNMLEGNKPAAAAQVASEKFRPVLLANYMLWPAANLINFALVPPEQRILYVNVIYVFWVSFLSYMSARPSESQKFAME